MRIVGELPVSAGGFADLWRGFLDDRQVAIKSYRPYLTVEPARVFTVKRSAPIREVHAANTPPSEVPAGSAYLQSSLPQQYSGVHWDLQHYKSSVLSRI